MSTVQLNFKQTGEGEAIVILHGLFGSLDNWQTMARELSEEGYQVTTVDLRNHGKTPHTDAMSLELMAEDVKVFLEENNLQGCTLVGHSMGGKTAMQLSMNNAELIEKLVIVDIAPKAYPAHHNLYFEAMLALDVSEIESRRDAQDKLKTKIKNKAVLQFLLKNLDRVGDNYDWKFNLKSLHENYDNLIGGLSMISTFSKPTLFIGGQLSDYISRSDEAQILNAYPNAKFEYIEKSGHWVHAEQPERFKEALLNFVRD